MDFKITWTWEILGDGEGCTGDGLEADECLGSSHPVMVKHAAAAKTAPIANLMAAPSIAISENKRPNL